MAVSIRMRRAGAKKRAFYHLVATDKRSPRDGRYIEKLGYYDPVTEPPVFTVDQGRLAYWLERGAKASYTVAQLLCKNKPKEQNDPNQESANP